jgi:hypothetical protein
MADPTTKRRFDRLLEAMATQPEPSEKPAKDNQTSDKASGAGHGDTRTREGKSASASSRPKRKYPSIPRFTFDQKPSIEFV